MKINIQLYVSIVAASVLISCGNAKNASSTTDPEKITLIGKVVLSESCGAFITIIGAKGKAIETGELLHPKTLYPVNLDEKFRKNNLKIHFQYVYSRAMSPENCEVDAVVSLINVKSK
jgi:hypothetical protein